MSNPEPKIRAQELRTMQVREGRVIEELVHEDDFEEDTDDEDVIDVTQFLTLVEVKPVIKSKPPAQRKKRIVRKKKRKARVQARPKPKLDDESELLEEPHEDDLRLTQYDMVESMPGQFKDSTIALGDDEDDTPLTPLTEEELEQKKAEIQFKGRYEYYRMVSNLLLADFNKNKLAMADLINRIETQLAAAEKAIKLDPPDYRAAENALLDIPLFGDKPIEKQAEKLAVELSDKAKREAPQAMKLYERMKASLHNLPLTIQARNIFVERLDEAVAVLKQPIDVTGKNNEVYLALAAIDREVEKAVKEANEAKQQYETLAQSGDNALLDPVEQDAPGVWPGYDASEIARLREIQADAHDAAKLHDYKAATVLLTQFQNGSKTISEGYNHALGPIEDDRNKALETYEWMEDGAFAKLAGTLLKMAETNGMPEPTKLELERLAGRLQIGVTAQKNKTTNPSGAQCVTILEDYEEAKQFLEGLKDCAAFLTGVLPVQSELVERALEALNEKVSLFAEQVGEPTAKRVQEFESRRDDLVKRWETSKATAVDKASLEALTYQDEAAEIGLQIDLLLQNKAPLQDEAALEQYQKRLAVEVQTAARRAGVLAGISAELGLELEKQIALARTVLDHSARPHVLEQAQQTLHEASELYASNIALFEGPLDDLSFQINVKLDTVSSKLLELTAKVQEADGERRQLHEGVLLGLRNERDSLAALATSRIRSVLETALGDAEKLFSAVDDAIRAIKGKKDVPNIAAEMLELAEVEKRLAVGKRSKVWQEYTYGTYAALETRIADAKSTKGSKGLEALQKERLAIDDAIDAMDKRALAAEQRFSEKGKIQIAAEKVRKLLGGTDFADAPDYRKAIERELEDIIANAKYEGRYAAGVGEVAALEQRLRNEVSEQLVPQKDQGEKRAKQERDLEVDKFEVEDFNLTVELNRLKGKVPKKEIEWGWKRLEEARKLAKTSKDYATGLETLESIRDRLALLAQNPVGLAMGGRDKLAQVDKEFKAAKVQFDGLLAKLAEKLSEVGLTEKDQLDATRKAVKGQADAVGTLLNYDAFTAAVAILANKKTDEKVRAATRERAMRAARQMMAVIETDYRIRELSRAPMLPEMSGAISRLQLALLNVENNMLVSL